MYRTPAQWEILEGELHDHRATRAVTEYNVKKLKAGILSPDIFATWWLNRVAKDREWALERFKNVTRRYQEESNANEQR